MELGRGSRRARPGDLMFGPAWRGGSILTINAPFSTLDTLDITTRNVILAGSYYEYASCWGLGTHYTRTKTSWCMRLQFVCPAPRTLKRQHLILDVWVIICYQQAAAAIARDAIDEIGNIAGKYPECYSYTPYRFDIGKRNLHTWLRSLMHYLLFLRCALTSNARSSSI